MKYPPTSQEIRAFLQQHDLTSEETADILRISSSAVRKWMRGDRPMPYTIWYTLTSKAEARDLEI